MTGKMTLWQILYIFLFAPATLARLSHASARDNNIINSTMESTYPNIGLDDVVYHYADLMSGPEPEDRFADVTATTTGWNPSAPVDGKIAIVRMSTVRQHVGEFAGQRLFDMIYEALMKICPYERGRIGCYPKMPGAGKPNDDNMLRSHHKYYDRFWILDVPYKTDKGEYASNAWLTITAQAIFREDKYPGLGAATYEMAAGVFKQATEISRAGGLLNCYQEKFKKNSRPYTFCNVPKHVLVALPANNGDVTNSWLSVTVEFNGKTEYGEFDCYNSMSGVTGFWESAVLPKSMKISSGDWNQPSSLCVECWNEDDRFDVKTWRDHHTCDFLGWKYP